MTVQYATVDISFCIEMCSKESFVEGVPAIDAYCTVLRRDKTEENNNQEEIDIDKTSVILFYIVFTRMKEMRINGYVMYARNILKAAEK